MTGFNCHRCGNCCRVSGYVRLKADEIPRIAEYLDLEIREFSDGYTRLTSDRRSLSLIEKPNGSCIFLEEDGTCRIQAVKPEQCRTFPTAWRFEGWEALCKSLDQTKTAL